MNPIYKFELATEYNGVTNNYAVYPLRKADLAKDYELQQNQKFFRAKLSGKLLFSRADYDIIANAKFETKFTLVISISWNNGQTWTEYWRGEFWKTDCKFDADAQTAEVTPAPIDDYTNVLAGMEKEYNLIDLKPAIEQLTITKRPMIQVYVPGQSVIACFLSGMYWETDCKEVNSESDLVNKYHFAKAATGFVAETSGNVTPKLPDAFIGGIIVGGKGNINDFSMISGNYTYSYSHNLVQEDDPITGESEYVTYTYWKILSGGVEMWSKTDRSVGYVPVSPLTEVTLNAVSGSGASGDVTIKSSTTDVYSRFITDCDKVANVDTYELGADDMVDNNRNYHRVVRYDFKDTIYFTGNLSKTPTKWGIYQPGLYYQEPYALGIPAFYPISKSAWGRMSIWFAFSVIDKIVERSGRKEYELRNSYPLHSVISVLLGKIAPGITHEPTTEYSKFLYDQNNPISGDVFNLYITPKSNILVGDYSQPAQKAPITLKMVTDMLRDCYRAYWYVEDGKFKIEHIQWFKNGGRYTGMPAISHDLTVEKVTRNGKEWAFGTSQYEYNKPTMPERYQFGWMDDVTLAFEGYPIEILSKYVTPGNIEEINVSNFTTDIDYMLLNPGACSKDGFALMAAVSRQGSMVLPFTERTIDGITYINQNGLLAFIDLQPKYYIYDLPAYQIRINDKQDVAYGITREKKQTLRMPVVDDPNPTQLIKTFLGMGQVEKISVNLSSRNANVTLMYDTHNYNE